MVWAMALRSLLIGLMEKLVRLRKGEIEKRAPVDLS